MVRIALHSMIEVEPGLNPSEVEPFATLLEMHSVLNALNVLKGSLVLISYELEPVPESLIEAQAYCERVCQILSDRHAVYPELARVPEKLDGIGNSLKAIESTLTNPHPRDFDECRDNILNVCRILNLRVAEIIPRAPAPLDWHCYPIFSIKQELEDIFRLIAKISHGRYRIAFAPEEKSPGDYLIQIQIESHRIDDIWMPALFKDVIRDLLANARKYTCPGGTIEVSLKETPTSLFFRVEDTGVGIPPDELEKVCAFGVRGSNVSSLSTMGGGFGLTKALYVTKSLGGRFFIASRLHHGTRIRIELPKQLKALACARSANPAAVGKQITL